VLINQKYVMKIVKKASKSYEAVVNLENMLLESNEEAEKAKPLVLSFSSLISAALSSCSSFLPSSLSLHT